MKFLLDSNILSEPTKPRPDPLVLKAIEQHASEACTGAPVMHELSFGVERLSDSKLKLHLRRYLDYLSAQPLTVLSYDHNAARWHALERARLSKVGKTAQFVDSQIAAIAAVNGLVLVTRNSADFRLFRGLKIANWFAA